MSRPAYHLLLSHFTFTGVLKPLLSLVYSPNEAIQDNVAGALRNCSINESNKQDLRELGGFEVFVNLLDCPRCVCGLHAAYPWHHGATAFFPIVVIYLLIFLLTLLPYGQLTSTTVFGVLGLGFLTRFHLCCGSVPTAIFKLTRRP